jgi:DNA modification methylase
MTISILVGDCRDRLAELPDASVDCVVTSPPYWGLRDYGVAGQLGLEADFRDYLAAMVAVFRAVRRVLRPDGTLWLNMGDSYATGTAGGRKPTTAGKHGYWENPAIAWRIDGRGLGLKPKDLVGMPWRVAFALQDDGWYLRQDIIWAKPNPMPESVTDRCTKAHEYLFLLSKSARYHFDAAAIREMAGDDLGPGCAGWAVGDDHTAVGHNIAERTESHGTRYKRPNSAGAIKSPHGQGFTRRAVGGSYGDHSQDLQAGMSAPMPNKLSARDLRRATGDFSRNKRSVWTIATAPFGEAHFATFPPALVEPCIRAGCPEWTCGACGIALDSRYGKGPSARTNGTAISDLQMVRRESLSGSEEPGKELLQQSVCLALDGEESEHVEGLHDHIERLSDAHGAASSICNQIRLCDGTQVSDGGSNGPLSLAGRDRASQGRKSSEQRPREPGSPKEDGARQDAKTADGNDHLSPLRREDHDFSICPSCGATLDEIGIRPGTVLDCFGGAGTTGLVADRLGRNAILIELNPAYAAMAQRRIAADAPLLYREAAQ